MQETSNYCLKNKNGETAEKKTGVTNRNRFLFHLHKNHATATDGSRVLMLAGHLLVEP